MKDVVGEPVPVPCPWHDRKVIGALGGGGDIRRTHQHCNVNLTILMTFVLSFYTMTNFKCHDMYDTVKLSKYAKGTYPFIFRLWTSSRCYNRQAFPRGYELTCYHYQCWMPPGPYAPDVPLTQPDTIIETVCNCVVASLPE